MNTLAEWKTELVKAATLFDESQRVAAATNPRKYWNPAALGMYIENIGDALKEKDFLSDPRKALANHFLIQKETGGIGYRNIPADLSTRKFTLAFINKVLRKAGK